MFHGRCRRPHDFAPRHAFRSAKAFRRAPLPHNTPFARRRTQSRRICRKGRVAGVPPPCRSPDNTPFSWPRSRFHGNRCEGRVTGAAPPQSTRCRTRGNVCAHCVVAPSCALRTCYPSDVARSRARVDHRLNCHRRASYVPCANYANPPFAACHPFYSMEKTAHFDPFGRVMKGSCPPILGSTTNAQNKWRGAFGTEG